MEVAVVQHLLPRHVDQRVLGGRVELHREYLMQHPRGVDSGSVDLRQYAVAERILEPAGGTGAAVQQRAERRRDRELAGVRVSLLDRGQLAVAATLRALL